MAESDNTLSPSEDLKRHGYHITRVTGVSMLPFLRQGKDTVQVVCGMPKKGDVALYQLSEGEKCVLHRVINIKGEIFIFRGDNCTAKEYVPKDKILGVLERVWKDGKEIELATDRGYKRYCRYIASTAFIRIPCKKIKNKLRKIFGKNR